MPVVTRLLDHFVNSGNDYGLDKSIESHAGNSQQRNARLRSIVWQRVLRPRPWRPPSALRNHRYRTIVVEAAVFRIREYDKRKIALRSLRSANLRRACIGSLEF